MFCGFSINQGDEGASPGVTFGILNLLREVRERPAVAFRYQDVRGGIRCGFQELAAPIGSRSTRARRSVECHWQASAHHGAVCFVHARAPIAYRRPSHLGATSHRRPSHLGATSHRRPSHLGATSHRRPSHLGATSHRRHSHLGATAATMRQGRAVHASAAQRGRGAPGRACMHASGAPRRACMHASACKWSSASCMHAVRSGRCGGRWPSTACRKATAAARRCAACWVSPSTWRSVEEAASSCQVERLGLSSIAMRRPKRHVEHLPCRAPCRAHRLAAPKAQHLPMLIDETEETIQQHLAHSADALHAAPCWVRPERLPLAVAALLGVLAVVTLALPLPRRWDPGRCAIPMIVRRGRIGHRYSRCGCGGDRAHRRARSIHGIIGGRRMNTSNRHRPRAF